MLLAPYLDAWLLWKIITVNSEIEINWSWYSNKHVGCMTGIVVQFWVFAKEFSLLKSFQTSCVWHVAHYSLGTRESYCGPYRDWVVQLPHLCLVYIWRRIGTYLHCSICPCDAHRDNFISFNSWPWNFPKCHKYFKTVL